MKVLGIFPWIRVKLLLIPSPCLAALYDTETPVDVSFGHLSTRLPINQIWKNTTANFPVMISGNKTEINVHVAPTGKSYVVPVGGTGYKNGTGEFTVIGGTTPDPEPDPDPEEPTTGAFYRRCRLCYNRRSRCSSEGWRYSCIQSGL